MEQRIPAILRNNLILNLKRNSDWIAYLSTVLYVRLRLPFSTAFYHLARPRLHSFSIPLFFIVSLIPSNHVLLGLPLLFTSLLALPSLLVILFCILLTNPCQMKCLLYFLINCVVNFHFDHFRFFCSSKFDRILAAVDSLSFSMLRYSL